MKNTKKTVVWILIGIGIAILLCIALIKIFDIRYEGNPQTQNVSPSATSHYVSTKTPTVQPTEEPINNIQEIVDAKAVNDVLDELLAINPEYKDPRISCDGFTDVGVILGNTGQCIPQFPQEGLCIEGSQTNPCDMVLVALYAAMVPEKTIVIGGKGDGYAFLYLGKDDFQKNMVEVNPEPLLFSRDFASWAYITVIQVSSADFLAIENTGINYTSYDPPIMPPNHDVVDAKIVAEIMDNMLALNPEYQDPRVDCNDVPGPGIQLGDTGVCIPEYPEFGFCVEGSQQYPCDMKLVSMAALYASENEISFRGTYQNYVFEFMFTETFETDIKAPYTEPLYADLNPLHPYWFYTTVIPASSANFDDMMDMGLTGLASLTPAENTDQVPGDENNE